MFDDFSQTIKPRLSTDLPDIPRWETDYELPDLDRFFQPQYETPVTEGMSLKRLTIPKMGEVPDQYAPKQQVSIDQMMPTGGVTGLPEHRGDAPYGFQTYMWNSLSRMNAAMKAAGIGTFTITDGFRSYQQQVDLKKRKPNLAATPGRSKHGLGIAADLKMTPAQQKWVQENAHRFSLKVPMPGKEPWHIEYA